MRSRFNCEQGHDARQHVSLADVLGQVVVGTQAQAGDDVEFGIPCGEEHDRQLRAATAQFPAQLEAPLDIVAQSRSLNRETRKPWRCRASR
jgi:hypothetical protein